MPAIRTIEIESWTQNRVQIFGISLKKLDRSTSFFVAPHVMLYENMWARMDCESGMERPPKKKKLFQAKHQQQLVNGLDSSGDEVAKRKQNAQERNPLDILQQSANQAPLAQPILQNREPDVTRPKEHNSRSQPDLERVHVEIVDGELPAEETVVDDADGDGAGDTVVGEHVGQHGDLVVEGRVGPDESVDLGGDGATGEPADEGVEEQPERREQIDTVSTMRTKARKEEQLTLNNHTNTFATDSAHHQP